MTTTKAVSDYDGPELVDDKIRTAQLALEEGLSFPSTYASLGLCQLNQWALDFDGNLRRIIQSIETVKRLGGYYRLGPELEVSGYSCDDHFNEFDTTAHCWQSICQILRSDLSNNCLLDIGMPVEHKSVRYNCRVFLLNQRVILIRPKMFLAQDGAYRETRWFGAWNMNSEIETFVLPKSIQRVIKQKTCPIGFAALQCNDCILAAESCEELFVPESPHLAMCLGGVDVFCNGSASYFEIRKLGRRLDLIMAPTQKMGGIYMYCNMKGNDGGKCLFDGNSFIACNGAIVNMISPMQFDDVEVMVERINISSVRSFRACNPSYAVQAACKPVPTIAANIWLSGIDDSSVQSLRLTVDKATLAPVTLSNLPDELARNIACWLWDYLRRSRAQGFMIPTSGGADSCGVACLVRVMCDLVMEALDREVLEVMTDLEGILRIKRDHPAFPTTSRDLTYQILHTCYLGMSHTTGETRDRARQLAHELGSYHLEVDIDEIVASQLAAVSQALGFAPRFKSASKPSAGGSHSEDIALQNAQARSRMVTTYLLSGLLPTLRAKDRLAPPPQKVSSPTDYPPLSEEESRRVGYLINLATGNIDETLRGYFTKYDCSSGDLGPIGSLSKVHLRTLLKWVADRYESVAIRRILSATPTAELRPNEDSAVQEDEAEMGLTYEELFLFGNMRKCERCGPVEMYELLVQRWKLHTPSVQLGEKSPSRAPSVGGEEATLEQFLSDPNLTARKIAEKVKHFFRTYSENRHKTTTLPPSIHVEGYDPEGTRHDWRPFLYPGWERQFRQIDNLVALAEEHVAIELCEKAVPHKKTLWFSGLPGGTK